MIVVGILGGIASGKSFVTKTLESLGAVVLDADRIGHQVLLRKSVREMIHQTWGKQVFDSRGEVDRAKLAEIVFDPTDPEQLTRLEKITHPLIEQQLQLEIRQADENNTAPMLVLDAPVMVKAGWYQFCDEIVFVETTKTNRWQRARQRGWTREMFDNREAMQTDIETRRKLNTVVIDNNGDREQTRRQVQAFWTRVVNKNKT